MNIITLRVSKDKVPAAVPFDRVYLVPRTLEGKIAAYFGTAFVFEAKSLIEKYGTIPLQTVYTRGHHREDSQLQRSVTEKIQQRIEGLQLDLTDWVAVLAVRTHTVKNKLRVSYTGCTAWDTRGKGPTLPDNTYLATPEGKIKHLCVQCDYSMGHLQGDCILGDPRCTKYMNVKKNASL